MVIGFEGYLCRENVAIWGVGDLTNWARAKEEADSKGAPCCRLGKMDIEENRSLAPLTTFGIGGPARWFAEATGEAEVLEAVIWAREKGLTLFVLGGGQGFARIERWGFLQGGLLGAQLPDYL